MRKVLKMTWPNMALTNPWDKTKNLVSKGQKEQTVKGEKKRRGRGRRRRVEEKERSSSNQKGMELCIDLYGTTWAFKGLNGFPCNCMVISCTLT